MAFYDFYPLQIIEIKIYCFIDLDKFENLFVLNVKCLWLSVGVSNFMPHIYF